VLAGPETGPLQKRQNDTGTQGGGGLGHPVEEAKIVARSCVAIVVGVIGKDAGRKRLIGAQGEAREHTDDAVGPGVARAQEDRAGKGQSAEEHGSRPGAGLAELGRKGKPDRHTQGTGQEIHQEKERRQKLGVQDLVHKEEEQSCGDGIAHLRKGVDPQQPAQGRPAQGLIEGPPGFAIAGHRSAHRGPPQR
jgi:hypothetical protein